MANLRIWDSSRTFFESQTIRCPVSHNIFFSLRYQLFFFRDLSFLADGHKPPVAHRDLSSSNVLVRADGTCALCDFGSSAVLHSLSGNHKQSSSINMSVRVWDQQAICSLVISNTVSIKILLRKVANFDTFKPQTSICLNPQAHAEWGTLRYLSPEILQGSVNLSDGTFLLQGDVYALALLLWEIWMRCSDLFQGKLAQVDSTRLLIHVFPSVIDEGQWCSCYDE